MPKDRDSHKSPGSVFKRAEVKRTMQNLYEWLFPSKISGVSSTHTTCLDLIPVDSEPKDVEIIWRGCDCEFIAMAADFRVMTQRSQLANSKTVYFYSGHVFWNECPEGTVVFKGRAVVMSGLYPSKTPGFRVIVKKGDSKHVINLDQRSGIVEFQRLFPPQGAPAESIGETDAPTPNAGYEIVAFLFK